MSETNYSCRISLLKCFAKSARHAKAFIDGGKNDETMSQRLGTGGHALTFQTPEVVVYKGGILKTEKVKKPRKKAGDDEQPEVAAPSVVRVVSLDPLLVEVSVSEKGLDGCEFTSKTYSDTRTGALWEAFETANDGKVILNQTEYDRASGMANALHSDPYAAPLLFAPGTQYEQLVEWYVRGRRCTGRFDALGTAAVGDLKCVTDASPSAFRRQAERYGWVAQGVWYADGCVAAGLGWRTPYLIAVESAAPHNVQVYELNADDIAFGRRQYNAWLDRLLECEAADYWPGYVEGIVPLNVRNLPPPPVEDDDENPWDVSSDDESDVERAA